MATHWIRVESHEPRTRRKLHNECERCGAQAGMPCEVPVDRYRFLCPDANCDQMYEKANDALNCMFHRRGRKKLRRGIYSSRFSKDIGG